MYLLHKKLSQFWGLIFIKRFLLLHLLDSPCNFFILWFSACTLQSLILMRPSSSAASNKIVEIIRLRVMDLALSDLIGSFYHFLRG
jgi:hypothetical protein